ncbi:MAG: glycosyltransferase family 2 protein [Polyangiaceae bacterium]
MNPPSLSFVIPLKDEQPTIVELFDRIREAVTALDRTYEVIFIDDGSTDASWSIIRMLADREGGKVRGIRFRRNLGKAPALHAGFKAARGEVVFTLDADLQDDPKEIGRFLEKLGEGFDIVSGWKKVRHDPWHKVLPSRVFNAMLSRVSATHLHDHNCGFKCYRARVVKELALYGEMHRMIPALSAIRGFKSSEIQVLHHPRRFGSSKYGFKRFARGFMDMMSVGFIQNYRERPLHLFGGMALALGALGVLAVTLGVSGLLGARAAMPLEILGGCLVGCSAPLMGLGLLAELFVHSTIGSRVALPVIEEVPAAEITVGASLSMLDGGAPPSSRGRNPPSNSKISAQVA